MKNENEILILIRENKRGQERRIGEKRESGKSIITIYKSVIMINIHSQRITINKFFLVDIKKINKRVISFRLHNIYYFYHTIIFENLMSYPY